MTEQKTSLSSLDDEGSNEKFHTTTSAQDDTNASQPQNEQKKHHIVNSDNAKAEQAAGNDIEIEPAPDGGLRAWLVAGGGAIIFFCTMGFSNAFGTFEQYYLTHQLQGESPSKVAWIGSVSIYLSFLTGMIGGPLFDRLGAVIIRPAALAYVFAMMMLSLCKTYWQIMLVQGVLMGFAMGFLQIPVFAAIAQYFDKKRGAALGLAISGSSIGGVVLPIALSKSLNDSSLGFGWTIRIIGFLILPLMAFSCIAVKSRLPPRKTNFWLKSAFKNTRFITLIFAFLLMFLAMLTPFFYLTTYATTQGMSALLAGYLLSILNAVSTFGRILPGILADKYGRINIFAAGGVITSITIFCMTSATTNAGLIVYAAFFGFASGTIISGGSAALSLCADDPRNIGTYMGMGLAWAGLGALIGPPVNGAFVATYGGYSQACYFSGAVCLLGSLIGFSSKALTSQGLFGKI